ncbi:hypothetical protein [Candidatus Poriferisodalis sp.]|uniref:hypothetical protein n=1 Tax=Candidatus Poriferisodalis sp. TaxID=3101277 RepID=UPI003B5C055A
MSLFTAARDRIRGSAVEWLQRAVVKDLDARVKELLAAAVDKWRADGWDRFDSHEDNCTVQVYRWIRECTRRDSRFALLTVCLQYVNVAPEILRGNQSAQTATRPDLRIEVAQEGRAIECKRIEPGGAWVRDYVHKGLARFVTGNYGYAEETGFMIGYVGSGAPGTLIARINGYINRMWNTVGQRPITPGRYAPPILFGASRHVRLGSQAVTAHIDICHLLVELDS